MKSLWFVGAGEAGRDGGLGLSVLSVLNVCDRFPRPRPRPRELGVEAVVVEAPRSGFI